jgi:plastocyanin
MENAMKKSLSFSVGGVLFAFFFVGVLLGAQWVEAQGGGEIKGEVKSPYMARYPALVYLDHVDGQFPLPAKKPFISQKGLVFEPHVLPVVKGTTVDFTNDDNVAHNVSSPPGSAKVFNLGLYGAGVTKTVTFDNLGEVPLLCSVHPEMAAFVIVLQNPYFAMTDKSGNFDIKNVPPGTYQLKVWDEKLQGAPQSVIVEQGKTVSVEFKDLKKR